MRLASATAGEFEPLRRYGIRIAKDGANLRLEWRKNGKVFRETVRDDQAALERAITEIMNKRFPEMMKRQSNNLPRYVAQPQRPIRQISGHDRRCGLFRCRSEQATSRPGVGGQAREEWRAQGLGGSDLGAHDRDDEQGL